MESLGIIFIFAMGIIIGSFGTLIGGGSLVSIPLLIFMGLPAHIAVATNRLSMAGLHSTGWYKFHKMGKINYKIGLILSITALFGSIIGANLLLQIDEIVLRQLVGVLTIIILIIIMLNPEAGLKKKKLKIMKKHYAAGAAITFLCGIYGGFFGAGVGILISFTLVLIFGQSFIESAATRKIAVTLVSVSATLVFIIKGIVDYTLGIPLLIGMSIGSYFGAHYSEKIGNLWIKRLFFIVVFLMALRLII